jgi:hypothetical protein
LVSPVSSTLAWDVEKWALTQRIERSFAAKIFLGFIALARLGLSI